MLEQYVAGVGGRTQVMMSKILMHALICQSKEAEESWHTQLALSAKAFVALRLVLLCPSNPLEP